jgi:hypothetical protein
MRVVAYELWRILGTKKYGYILLGLCLLALYILNARIYHGFDGTAPYSALSFSHYLVGLNGFLLPLLILLCVPVFDAREQAVRRILFATPISPRTYYLIKISAIGTGFGITVAILVLVSVVFYSWEFQFFAFHKFVFPFLLFLASPALLLVGISLTMGQWNVKWLYMLIPVVWLTSILNVDLPTWLDLAGNNHLLWHTKMVARQSLLGGEPAELMQPTLIWSRVAFAAVGILLLAWVCRSRRNRN